MNIKNVTKDYNYLDACYVNKTGLNEFYEVEGCVYSVEYYSRGLFYISLLDEKDETLTEEIHDKIIKELRQYITA